MSETQKPDLKTLTNYVAKQSPVVIAHVSYIPPLCLILFLCARVCVCARACVHVRCACERVCMCTCARVCMRVRARVYVWVRARALLLFTALRAHIDWNEQ